MNPNKWLVYRVSLNNPDWYVQCGSNPWVKCECDQFPTWREAWDYAIAKATETAS